MQTEADYRRRATAMREIADEVECDRDFKAANEIREIARHFDEKASRIRRRETARDYPLPETLLVAS